MKNFRTKSKRLLTKTLNKVIKSNKITKNISLFLLFYLICFMLIHLADFYIWEMQVARIFLVGLIITFIWALFYKQKNTNRKDIKKYNYLSLLSVIFICCCVGHYAFGVIDGSNVDNMKKLNILSTDDIDSLKNVEDFLIQEKQIFIREKNESFYTIKSLDNSYRRNAFLIVKMAEQGILNPSIHIDLIQHQENFQTLSNKLRKFLYCYLDGVNQSIVDIEYCDKDLNITKANITLYISNGIDINKIKQTVTNIMLSSVNGLTEKNIHYDIIAK